MAELAHLMHGLYSKGAASKEDLEWALGRATRDEDDEEETIGEGIGAAKERLTKEIDKLIKELEKIVEED